MAQPCTPPELLWNSLDPLLPIALLPVRLETRFGTRSAVIDDGSTCNVPVLRVRIYPDDISVVRSPGPLRAAETDAGSTFWDQPTPTAWEVFVRRVGLSRSVHVAKTTRPGAQIEENSPTGLSARLLPDGWVIVGEVGGKQAFAHHVRRTGDLQIGPVDGSVHPPFNHDQPLLFAEDDPRRWMTDFDVAVAAGMAAVIDLATVDEARSSNWPAAVTDGLSALFVVGLREPTPQRAPAQEARVLAGLIADHASTHDHVSFVPQGTPSNNLSNAPAGWTSAKDIFAAYVRAMGTPEAVEPEGDVPLLTGRSTDGRAFEQAFGLPSGSAATLGNASGREQWHSRNMNLALFPTTLGETLVTLTRRSEDGADWLRQRLDTVVPFVRSHFASFVRGRGPLPALRIGRQPYGVLPVMPNPTQWHPMESEDPLLPPVFDILTTLRHAWTEAAAAVPALSPGQDHATQLNRILGQGPVPHPGSYLVTASRGVVAAYLLRLQRFVPAGSPEALGVAVGSELAPEVYRSILASALTASLRQTPLEQLQHDGPSRMTALVAADSPDATQWGKGPADYLRKLIDNEFIDNEPRNTPTDLLFVLAEHSLELALESDIYRVLDVLDPQKVNELLAVAPELLSMRLSSVEASRNFLQTPIATLPGKLPPPSLRERSVHESITDPELRSELATYLDLTPESISGYAQTADAVRNLADSNLVTRDYERLTSETLACVSNRLDAWLTSIATRRLASIRTQKPAGIQIGAWGVLVDVKPSGPAPDAGTLMPASWPATNVSQANIPAAWPPPNQSVGGPLVSPPRQVGYIHAPSIAHARTGAVLRAGEMFHGDDSTLGSIDLTSRRARTATHLVEEMANGQTLGALLGYQLERALNDSGMHAEVDRLRSAFPQRRTEETTPAPGSDAVAPANVVDGLEVQRNREQARQVAKPSSDQFDKIIDNLDLAVDAVADLLVAEGVHTITSGRFTAAGALFTSLSEAAQPPEITVTREPRSGITLTNRVLVAFDETVGTDGWKMDTARAEMAPRTEKWVQTLLGPAKDWTIGFNNSTPVRLDVLGICALDVISETQEPAPGVRLLDRRIYTHTGTTPQLGDDPTDSYSRLIMLAQSIFDVLAAARPIVPTDVAIPAPATSVDDYRVEPVAPPSAVTISDVALPVVGVLARLQNAVSSVTSDASHVDIGKPISADDAKVFAELGLLRTTTPTPSAPGALAAATEGLAILRDVDSILGNRDGSRESRASLLTGLSASSEALGSLVKVARRLGGSAVVPTLRVPSSLPDSLVEGVRPIDVERWINQLGRVRDTIATYDDLRLFEEAIHGTTSELHAFQMPLRQDEGWLGGELPEKSIANGADSESNARQNPLRKWVRPDSPRIHIVAAGSIDVLNRSTIEGLVVDEVAEVLPEPTVTTGAAVYFDAPNARPPQAVLLAVHPDPSAPWSWELVVDASRESLALSRLRGVELDDLSGIGLDGFLPLTYVRDNLPQSTSTRVLVDQTPENPWPKQQTDANRRLITEH